MSCWYFPGALPPESKDINSNRFAVDLVALQARSETKYEWSVNPMRSLATEAKQSHDSQLIRDRKY